VPPRTADSAPYVPYRPGRSARTHEARQPRQVKPERTAFEPADATEDEASEALWKPRDLYTAGSYLIIPGSLLRNSHCTRSLRRFIHRGQRNVRLSVAVVGATVARLGCMLVEMTRRELHRPFRAERTALVVEDDPRLLEATTQWFESMSFRVLSARHFDAAIVHLAQFRAHVVCVNIELPSKSGYELCEYIRGPLGLSGLPIIVTSERGHAEDRAQAEEVGANAFLQKPFSLRQLTRSVESLLDRAPSRLPAKGDLERLSGYCYV
jgi:CheY-like chemotaxis protein